MEGVDTRVGWVTCRRRYPARTRAKRVCPGLPAPHLFASVCCKYKHPTTAEPVLFLPASSGSGAALNRTPFLSSRGRDPKNLATMARLALLALAGGVGAQLITLPTPTPGPYYYDSGERPAADRILGRARLFEAPRATRAAGRPGG